jgi:hypothetical protein
MPSTRKLPPSISVAEMRHALTTYFENRSHEFPRADQKPVQKPDGICYDPRWQEGFDENEIVQPSFDKSQSKYGLREVNPSKKLIVDVAIKVS